MKKSELMLKAIPFLWDGIPRNLQGEIFVCHAIDKAGLEYKQTGLARDIKKDINKNIENKGTVTMWLLDRGYSTDIDYKYRQDYRKRWMKHMAKQYEQKGQ